MSATNRRLLLALGLAASAARGDGAFPASTQVWVPADHPQQIILGTNRGLFISEDDGATWRFVEELAVNGGSDQVSSYQVGPDETLYALTATQVYVSTDLGCSWKQGTWPPGLSITDLFPDPVDPMRVFALGHSEPPPHSTLFVSTDRGRHFTQALYSETNGILLGVENARSRPSTIYLTGSHGAADGGTVRYVAQSLDAGGSFVLVDHPELGNDYAGIIQVDPQNPELVYLRVGYIGADSLYAATDGGAVLKRLLQLPGAMAGFAQSSSGALFVVENSGQLWSGTLTGSFTPRAGPRFACLAARGTTLFACASGTLDGYDLGRSDDNGATFTKLINITDGSAKQILGCQPDAGTVLDGGADAGVVDAGVPDAGTLRSPPPKQGCGCDATAELWAQLSALLLLRRGRTTRAARAAAAG